MNQTGACGMLRLNRRGIPDDIKQATPPKEQTVTERDRNLLYICWTDKSQVNILMSFHNSSTFRKQVRCKQGQGKQPNDIHQIVDKPKGVEVYTKKMGGMDRAGQKVALYMYISMHRTTEWWKKLGFFSCAGDSSCKCLFNL